MHNSTLIAHSPKFQSKLVSRDQLAMLPEPQAQGSRHKPVPHIRLVEGILEEVEKRDLVAVRQQYALGAKGQALFGVLDLAPKPDVWPDDMQVVPTGERGISFGFRSSTNESLAIKGVAGTRVFVCDNLSLSGDLIAFNRKSTTGLDLGDVLAAGFDKFIQQEAMLEVQITRLTETIISDGEAKQRIFDIFNAKVVPVRLFDDVSHNYFKAADDMTDCQPRSLWGLHNSFTRAMRDLTPVRQLGATIQLGRSFGMRG